MQIVLKLYKNKLNVHVSLINGTHTVRSARADLSPARWLVGRRGHAPRRCGIMRPRWPRAGGGRCTRGAPIAGARWLPPCGAGEAGGEHFVSWRVAVGAIGGT